MRPSRWTLVGSPDGDVWPVGFAMHHGGPPGWGGFDQVDSPRADQWTYHAVADVILAHSLLRSLPEVDADRTGVTGISWGGYLTCIVAGVDADLNLPFQSMAAGFIGTQCLARI